MSEFNAGKILLVGLGNPGRKYQKTRHNVGRAMVQQMAEIAQISLKSSSFDGTSGSGRWRDQQIVLLLPDTYMNLSGHSVQKAMHYYRIEPQNLIVVHDEIEIPMGQVRLKRGGGHAGHNGLRSVDQQLGTKQYLRIRLGVGRPEPGGDVANWVLSRFSKADADLVYQLMATGTTALEELLRGDLATAQNKIHALK